MSGVLSPLVDQYQLFICEVGVALPVKSVYALDMSNVAIKSQGSL